MTEGDKPQFHGQHYSLYKAIIEKICVILSETTQHPEIRSIDPRCIPKGTIFVAPLLYLSRTKYPLTIGINEDRDNQTGMISILASSTEFAIQAGCINLLKNIFIQVTYVFARQYAEDITWK